MRARSLGLFVALALAASLAASPEPATSQVTEPAVAAGAPNVLLILVDDQRVGTMRAMRHTKKWFRRGGTRYPSAFATTPLCCPSRASIMSGRYSHNHGVRTNDDTLILDHRTTIQRYLQDAGYRTAVVGKFFNRWKLDPPHFHEWRTFDGTARYRRATYNVNGVPQTIRQYSTDYIAEEASRLIRAYEAEDQRPWFLYVAPFAPHAPYQPAPRHRKAKVGRWKGNPATEETDRSDKPPWVQGKRSRPKKAAKIRAGQLRTQRSIDDLVRTVFRTMQRSGEVRDTLAIFLSDHGLLWGEHGLLQKQSPYTASVRIPLMVRWPGRVPRGAADRRLVATVDVAPTIMQAAGVTPDPDLPVDGRSLLATGARDRMLLEFTKRVTKLVPSWAGLRTDAIQYVEYYDDGSGEVIFREYYDLVNDPWQLVNLLGDADPANDPPPDELIQLSTQLARDRGCRGTEGQEACP